MRRSRIALIVAALTIASGMLTWLVIEENTPPTNANAAISVPVAATLGGQGKHAFRVAQQQPNGTELQTSEQQEEQQEQQQQGGGGGGGG